MSISKKEFSTPPPVKATAIGRAHEEMHAAAEFQKIIDHRGIVLNFPLGALARLGLARAYAMQSDSTHRDDRFSSLLDSGHRVAMVWRCLSPQLLCGRL